MGVAPTDRLTGMPAVAVSVRKRRGRIAAAAVTVIETFRLALDALRAHKLRSFLTLLGVILAVATLVAVMSVVAGLNFYVADRVANLGANVYLVDRFGIITSQDAWIKAQKRPLVTLEEYQRLRENMKSAANVAATDDRIMDVRSGNILLENTDLTGVTPNYAEIRNMNLAAGRFLTEGDDLHHAPVCFIGTDVVKKFFPTVDPIGKTIRAGTNTYEVVGVAAEIGSAFGQSQDNYILLPFATYYKDWHKQNDWLTIFVQAQNSEVMQESEDEARMLMRAWRHLPYDAPDNFAVFGSASIMALVEPDHWQSVRGCGSPDCRFPGGRRYRNHEHHARQRDRTHPRDRIAPLSGRKKKTHRLAVHDRIRRACRRGRNNGIGLSLWNRGLGPRRYTHSGKNPAQRGDYFAQRFYRRRSFLWNLSRHARSETGSHRSAPRGRLRYKHGPLTR